MKLYGKNRSFNKSISIRGFSCVFATLILTVAVSFSAAAQLTPGTPALLNTNGTSDVGVDFVPQVTTDGAGNWVAVWASTENLGGSGTDRDLFVSTSTDNGATWTAPALLNTNGTTDAGDDIGPQVTTDGSGNWVAVWESTESLGGAGTDNDIFVALSTDNGATWTPPALLNTNATTDAGDDIAPQVTTDGAGNWVTVWESTESLGGAGTDNDIFVALSTDNGATWTPPALLNTNATTDTGSDRFSQVTTDGAGNWVAVWHSDEDLDSTAGTDHDIFVAAFVFPGGGGGGGGGCLVATAAYGTPMENRIDVLREVRDTYLLNTAAGAAFVDAYYTFSPPLADFVAKHPAAATTVRALLTPIIALAGTLWALPLLAGTFVMAAGYVLRRRNRSLVKAKS